MKISGHHLPKMPRVRGLSVSYMLLLVGRTRLYIARKQFGQTHEFRHRAKRQICRVHPHTKRHPGHATADSHPLPGTTHYTTTSTARATELPPTATAAAITTTTATAARSSGSSSYSSRGTATTATPTKRPTTRPLSLHTVHTTSCPFVSST